MGRYYLAVEIGATKQQMGLCDSSGKIVKLISEKIDLENGARDVLDWIEARVKVFFESKEWKIRGIGVGFGGPLESRTGRVIVSVQVPGWKEFELKKWFREKFKLPLVIVNDTVSGGYAELSANPDSRHFYYINIGSGIGGSLFINRIPYDGIGFGAAYTGQTYVSDWTSGDKGAYQTLENMCSGFAIEKRLRTPGYVPDSSKLFKLCEGNVSALTCAMMGSAAGSGDPFAIEEIERVALSMGIALSNVVNLLSVDTISVGGGVANLGEQLLKPIRENTEKLAFISAKGRFKIVQSTYLDKAVIAGAALFARDGFHAC